MAREAVEHTVLERSEVHVGGLAVGMHDLAASQVDRRVAKLQGRQMLGTASTAPQGSANARKQLGSAEGLRHIVVGPGVECGDLLLLHRPSGDYDDRDG